MPTEPKSDKEWGGGRGDGHRREKTNHPSNERPKSEHLVVNKSGKKKVGFGPITMYGNPKIGQIGMRNQRD